MAHFMLEWNPQLPDLDGLFYRGMPLSAAIGQPLLVEIFQALANIMSHRAFLYKTSQGQRLGSLSRCQAESTVKPLPAERSPMSKI